ncbi:hypothetical protein RHSIM_Rhsim02G0085300 [Rhododendron simsii]|uniref:RING-type E3 ubiquitin transferase n=1 Tax=Rhododendron simsii TaxID=118357 RepID=A0A834LTN2_RHOSS|nr:hypothetical protein RHSIM_Rhsim02G0085300 [Rhododendron simsii]
MANPEDSNPGSRNAETPAELKKEREIETTDEAIRIVSSPRELKIKESAPKEIKCPISAEIMGDPVVVASGQIANRIKGFIDAAMIASSDQGYLDSLLDNMMSSSLSDQKSSAEILRWLTDESPPNRDLLGNNEAVSKMLEPLAVPGNACLDLHLQGDIQGDIITTVLNISLPKGNKKVVAENPRVIPLIIDALRTGTTMTKRNAAAALSKLSELDSNRTLIVECGALGPLIRLVGEGNPETMANGYAAMYMLCCGPITNTLPSAVEEMGRMGAVACLLKIMRKRGNKDSNAVESCTVILFDICSYDKDELKEVQQEEAAKGTISRVALRGTQSARRKATGILEMGNKVG